MQAQEFHKILISLSRTEKNLHNSAWENGMVQHSDITKKPLHQQWILKKAERQYYIIHVRKWKQQETLCDHKQHISGRLYYMYMSLCA